MYYVYTVHSGATWWIPLNRPWAAASGFIVKFLWPLVSNVHGIVHHFWHVGIQVRMEGGGTDPLCPLNRPTEVEDSPRSLCVFEDVEHEAQLHRLDLLSLACYWRLYHAQKFNVCPTQRVRSVSPNWINPGRDETRLICFGVYERDEAIERPVGITGRQRENNAWHEKSDRRE